MIQQTSPVSVSVAEHSDVGTLITVISAVDTVDFGVNTRVSYEIISGNEDCEFASAANSGVFISLVPPQLSLLSTMRLEWYQLLETWIMRTELSIVFVCKHENTWECLLPLQTL